MRYWKLAKPDGWDFYTGNTINYRDNIGKTVSVKKVESPNLCSSDVIHAGKNINDCFIGASIPCSVFRVEGKAVIESEKKCGFQKLKILKEYNPEKVFKWNYKLASNPYNPLQKEVKKVTKKDIELLKKWASVGASVGASVKVSVWASVEASVRAYIGYIFKDCINEWEYVNHKKGEYPFQSAVDLWHRNLVPSYDGKTWRLHTGKEAKIVYELISGKE